MIPSQMLKGILEGCILIIISQEEAYGYTISEKLKQFGFGEVSEGTIYPILLRMVKNELVETVYRQSNQGPKRKYYYLSEKGKEEVEDFKENWRELSNAVETLLKQEEQ